MSKFGPLVESTIPTVITTVENQRNLDQNNSKESVAEEEEEYKKEEKSGKISEKRILKSNEKLRSRGRIIKFYFILYYYIDL